MPAVDVSSTNPYAVTTTEVALPPLVASDSNVSLLVADDRTNVGGRLWLPCRQMVYADRIELNFVLSSLTIPIKQVRLLRSAGKRFGRHLEIIHDEQTVPQQIHLIPLFPAQWYETFESLGIATEDETELRESKQLYHRSSVWVSNAEGLFALLWIGLIVVGSLVAGVVSLIKGLLG